MMSFTNTAFYTVKNRRAHAVNVVDAIALGLSETKTIRSLGPVQKARIVTTLDMIASGVRVDRVAEIIMSER